jgi:hypothetical protein
VDLKLFILGPAFPIIPDSNLAPDLTLKLSHVNVYAALWIRICIDFGRLDLDWIRIQSGQWIRIQEGNNDPNQKKKSKKISGFEALDVLF